MTKFKSRALTLILIIAITLFIISPKVCMQATSNGIKVWLVNVVPALFPFFILTKIIILLNQTSIKLLDKFTIKFFKTNNAGVVYFLSLLSGYPVGAKMISGYYESGAISKNTAKKMFSFCSTSGPMFIIGTVGIAIFKSSKVGYILLLSHLIGSFLNGLLYRGKNIPENQFKQQLTTSSLNDIMYDSINSILLVGGYIIFSSVVIELLKLSGILVFMANLICKITSFNYDVVFATLCGVIEITNGLILLGKTNIDIKVQLILASSIIAFSGICIMLQSCSFLNKTGLKKRIMLKQKLTQALFTGVVALIIVNIFY